MQNNGVSIAVFFILLFFWIFFHHVSEQSLLVAQEHQAAEEIISIDEEENIVLYEQSCQEYWNGWEIFTTQSYYNIIWGLDKSLSPSDVIKRKKERDILNACRAAYWYGQITCDEVEAIAQNKYSQKQLLSIMVQRIIAFKKNDASNRFDNLLRMWREDIAFLASKKELYHGAIIDQINRWQWTLADCLQPSNELKQQYNNWDWTKQVENRINAIIYNKNLMRYDTMVYLDLPIPPQIHRDSLLSWEAEWKTWVKTPAQRVQEIKPSLYNTLQTYIAETPSKIKYNPASPRYNQPSFTVRAQENKTQMYPNIQAYIQQAHMNNDNNREAYRLWLHQQWATMSAMREKNTSVPVIEQQPEQQAEQNNTSIIQNPELLQIPIAQPTPIHPIPTPAKQTNLPTQPVKRVSLPSTPPVNPYLQLVQPNTTTTNNSY